MEETEIQAEHQNGAPSAVLHSAAVEQNYTSDESNGIYCNERKIEENHVCKYFACISLMLVHIKHIKICQICLFQVNTQICLFRLAAD